MVSAVGKPNNCYPDVWVRWVTQQIRVAVSFELTTTDPTRWPHLRRLPLAVNVEGVKDEVFLRKLIAYAAGSVDGDADQRIDAVVEAVLSDEAVAIAEPDLQTMLAWRLAEHHCTASSASGDSSEWDASTDHECLDPEVVAADLVVSGLIAPAWRSTAPATHNYRSGSGAVKRRGRRPAVSPLQIAAFTL